MGNGPLECGTTGDGPPATRSVRARGIAGAGPDDSGCPAGSWGSGDDGEAAVGHGPLGLGLWRTSSAEGTGICRPDFVVMRGGAGTASATSMLP
ncbi:MAG: hypothetical protein AAF721_10035, partial [Myxococcota bacterium]